MKTATVTWIYFNNYGTQLQAYALQNILKKKGFENEILYDEDIVNEIYSRYYSSLAPEIKTVTSATDSDIIKSSEVKYFKRIKFIFKKALRAIELLLSKQKRLHRKEIILEYKKEVRNNEIYSRSQKKYEEFKSKKLKIKYGIHRDMLNSLNKEYDCFICGSDQIWSTLDKNFDGYFYLDFVKKNKVAYAVSIGADNIPTDKADKIKTYTQNFDLITLREKSSVEIISQIIEKQTFWVCDPTLLLERTDWNELCKDVPQERTKYLLCYFLSDNNWYFEYAESLSEYLGLKIIMLAVGPNSYKQKYNYDKAVGPIEFVSLFKSAEFVLTDSYHGSIFSFIYEKPLIHLQRFKDNEAECQNNRIKSLFGYLNLNSIIVEEKKFSKDDIVDINYIKVNEQIKKFRDSSLEILMGALERIDNDKS